MDDRHARHRRSPTDRARGPQAGYRTRDAARFARLVTDALATLPVPLRRHLDGVTVRTEEVPPPAPDGQPALVELHLAAPAGSSRVTVYRRPLEMRAAGRDELAELVRAVVVDRLADHHGWSDEDLAELGW